MESETVVTIQAVMDFLTTPSIDSPDTVDRLLFGHPSDVVTAIAAIAAARSGAKTWMPCCAAKFFPQELIFQRI